MNNLSLHKSLRLLTHPATLGALALLLLNDHVLRRLWPSWFTGKLGDVAWLFFAPLAVAMLVSLLLPRRARLTACISFGLVGGVFVLAKTLPVAHAAVIAAGEALFGFPIALRRDPTDLMALVGLAGSVWLWRHVPDSSQTENRQAERLPRGGWVALGCAALLTVANSPAPDPGVFCLSAVDGKVHAFAAYSSYESTDGGLSWATSNQPPTNCGKAWEAAVEPELMQDDVVRPGIIYRIQAGQPIELSQDGGRTWQPGYDLPRLSESEQAMTQRRLGSNVTLRPVPMDGVIDPATGNAVFAMGYSGVVVHAATGEWRPVGVMQFRQSQRLMAADFVELLAGEGLLALGMALLAFVTLVLVIDPARRAWQIILLAFATAVWLAVVFFLGPAKLSGYAAAMSYIGMLGFGLLALILLITSIVRLVSLRPRTLPLVATALGAGLLFLMPFIFWAANALPSYLLAAGFGVVLAALTIYAGSRKLASAQELR